MLRLSIIRYLRHKLIDEYKFSPESTILVTVNPEDMIQIELKIKNTPSDAYFCEKAYTLQRDVSWQEFSFRDRLV